jgi:hypothetical protein
VSGLETLPPDQRAVLQLILVQGRGYADLAATLRLDAAAVRERAHAGAEALGLPSGGELDADTRSRVVDYLLGQQDDGERIVTFAELGDSPAACRWAQALRERLVGVAREELPEVPAAAAAPATNGSSAHAGTAAALAAATAPPHPPPVAPAPAAPQPHPQPAAPAAAAAATAAAPTSALAPRSPAVPGGGAGAVPPPAAAPASDGPSRPSGPRPSRLGGAILIAGAAALAIVLAIVLIGGGGDGGSGTPASTSGARAQTQASARTHAATNGASRQPAARTVGGAVLRPTPAGGGALGAGLVQQSADGRRLLAVEAARLPANGAQDIYAIWLQGTAGTKFLGFVPRRVGTNGTFTVSSPLAKSLNLAQYATLLVTREGTTAVPTTPGTAILSGALRLTG